VILEMNDGREASVRGRCRPERRATVTKGDSVRPTTELVGTQLRMVLARREFVKITETRKAPQRKPDAKSPATTELGVSCPAQGGT